MSPVMQKTAIFRLDGNEDGAPGLARVKLLKQTFTILGYKVWRVEITEIIRPSTIARTPKVGQKFEVSERHMDFAE